MKRPVRQDDGFFHMNGKTYKELFGSRQQVFNGTAYKTAGCLTKNDLVYTKNHRIVSRKKHISAKKEMRLVKHGYHTEKGKFGYVKHEVSKTKTKKCKKNCKTIKSHK
jgi:hypothetical protein